MSRNIIEVHCRTKLDDYSREEWPIFLTLRPMIGDRIAARSGRHLKVINIIHRFGGGLEIELHH